MHKRTIYFTDSKSFFGGTWNFVYGLSCGTSSDSSFNAENQNFITITIHVKCIQK